MLPAFLAQMMQAQARTTMTNRCLPSDPLVLNVNDSDAVRYMITRMLRSAHFNVIEANSGYSALEQVRNAKPRLVILDIKMPDLNGLEVCRRIKADQQTFAIKILHTSAVFVSPEFKVQSLESGADGYLTHPFEQEELIATARSLLRLTEAEQNLRDTAAELRAANKRTHEFLAMLAHELRNPLSAITTCLPLLERQPVRDRSEGLAREIIQRQTLQLRRMVDDLLDVARVTQGKIEPQWETVDLNALLRTACQTAQRTKFDGRQQHLAVKLPEEPLCVRADVVRLEQSFANLLDNASKYSEQGGSIELSADVVQGPDGDCARVIVRDNGVGIAPDMLSRIFDLFSQADVPLARSRGGLGIGLTLARSLIAIHGGTIHVSSEGLGKGSEFEVLLPVLATVKTRIPTERREGIAIAQQEKRRVLVVEDNPDVQVMLKTLLESWGHEVWVASDGRTGIRAIESLQPDVALVDIGLPALDGYEVARHVNEHPPLRRPYLVALTGYSAPEQKERAMTCGFDLHLTKPAQPAELAELMCSYPARVSRGHKEAAFGSARAS